MTVTAAPFPRRVVAAALSSLVLSAVPALAQQAGEPPVAPLAYAGADTRLGVGYDSRAKVRGEFSHAFSTTDSSAWLGTVWAGDREGGLQLDYHWLTTDRQQVAKVFAAWDRNEWNDQKLSIGAGLERQSWFLGAYASGALTDSRLTNTLVRSSTETRQGTDATGPYLQDFTTVVTTHQFARAYDHGVGLRAGHFYDEGLLRLTAGLDHEWGDASSRQNTLTLAAEKFFAGSPHSIMLTASVAHRSGDFETRDNEKRVAIWWRYEFDTDKRKNWQPSKTYRKVAVTEPAAATPAITAAAPAGEPGKQVVKISEMVAAETFFDIDRATLRKEATRILDDLAERVRKASLQGPLQVTGHTCNLGPAAYNQRLSERRAAAVREYLVSNAGLPADKVAAAGKGVNEPKYPNTRLERHLNRRCDIEFTVVTDQVKVVPATATTAQPAAIAASPVVAWRYEEEAVPSPWIDRALRHALMHKREVDVYATQDVTTIVSEGPKVHLNRAPLAADDAASWYGTQMPAILNVLANDSDPDGNPITVISATNGSRGTVTVLPDGRLQYLWNAPREGIDHFTYTIADQYGATSTATVTLTVIDP
jgi:outer membrane protein OmpA-like peptidoglycan-associated protein